VGANNGKNMFYIIARSHGVSCKGNGWPFNTRDYSMAISFDTKYPPFATWLLNIVKVQTIKGVDVDLNVINFSCPPNPITYMYKNM
jgi:hypothetical protein